MTVKPRSFIPVAALLGLFTLAVYFQTRHFEFLNFDDNLYVFNNPHVLSGVNRASLLWMWRGIVCSNWHPVTMFTHMLDVQLFGANPGPAHLVNAFLHTSNVILLFGLLNYLTGAFWRSSFAAALFALHPTRVESVAWISERKDVLSAFFFMLILWMYARYAQSDKKKRIFYLSALGFYVLGLMSKPMLVTVPVMLLLLDLWPLERIRSFREGINRIIEKIPFFALSAASCLATLWAQQKTIGSLEKFTVAMRLENAVYSYGRYLLKTVWPHPLVAFYPYDADIPFMRIGLSAAALLAISVLAVWQMKRQPWILTGWLWFVLMLIPVIGLVQVGAQAMAERYTYLPYIGLFMMGAWLLEPLARWNGFRRWVPALCILLLILCARETWSYAHVWKNSISLFEHALKVSERNYVAHNNLGLAYFKAGRVEDAIHQYARSIAINAYHSRAYNNMASALSDKGDMEKAVEMYLKAIALNPKDPEPYYSMGVLCAKQGRHEKAIMYYQEAIRLNPEDQDAQNNLGNVYLRDKKFKEAGEHYRRALEIYPKYDRALYGLGESERIQGRLDEALAYYEKAAAANPDYAKAWLGIGKTQKARGDLVHAAKAFQKALELDGELEEARREMDALEKAAE